MPADKYGFAPTSATFTASQSAKYDGVRTFAQEISHVATANYYFASKILGEKMPVDPKSIQGLTTKEELLKAAADSFAYPRGGVSGKHDYCIREPGPFWLNGRGARFATSRRAYL
jgi:hypothetical protein